MNDHLRIRYKRHRNRYLSSIFTFCLMLFVLTMSVLVWFTDGKEGTFTSKLCASYIFLTLNFVAIIGRSTFSWVINMSSYVLLHLSPAAISIIFFILAFDTMCSAVICACLALLDIEIGAFGVIHIFVRYVPLALLAIVVLPNRLYRLMQRRAKMQRSKRRIS